MTTLVIITLFVFISSYSFGYQLGKSRYGRNDSVAITPAHKKQAKNLAIKMSLIISTTFALVAFMNLLNLKNKI